MNKQTVFDKQHYITQMQDICSCITNGIKYDLNEIIIDNFAGGGGASTGIESATGYSVYAAINHDPEAIRMHMANHPTTHHFCESVWNVNPIDICKGHPVGLAWFSPDCKHFSKAKGGKPKDKAIRGLAWVALRWAGLIRPRVIMLENVEEFKDWGPLNRNHRPIKSKKGVTFKKFVKQLEKLGYSVEYRELVAADYGAPTTRKRFFLIARCDGLSIVWPERTHAPADSIEVKQGIYKAYLGAYTQIDFSRPCPSIFATKKEILKEYGIKAVRPLAENTMKRITRGLQKFVLDNPEPFIIQVNHGGDRKPLDIKKPLPTITAKNGFGMVNPYIVSNDNHFLIAPSLIQYHSETTKDGIRGQNLTDPIMTLDGSNRYGLVSTFLSTFYSNTDGKEVIKPLQTVTAEGQHSALCTAYMIQQDNQSTTYVNHTEKIKTFLIKYYGNGTEQDISEPSNTITSNDRFGLVQIQGMDYQIIDIGLRMLDPDELYGCMGFPNDYIIDRDCNGKEIKRSEQIRKCGNAVSPPIPSALVKSNLPDLCIANRLPICRLDRLQIDDSGQMSFA